MHPRFSNLVLTTAALIALSAAPAAGGPEGGAVVGGAATIQGQGGPAVIVNQATNSAIINWNTFNIGVKESIRFNQPGSSSVVLNRVTGGLGPSEILGTLTANGRVFLINRDGILFGPSAVVNTASFLATTHDIRNSDFMAGRYNFNIPGRPDASIVNQGRITAASGGFAALVAPGVRNSGTITATLGTVALASGNSFTLDMYGDKLITLAVNDQIASKVIDVATGRPLKSLVSNEGKIRANGGRVELTAAAARVVVDSVINTSGVIKANSIGHRNGMIVLAAATGGSKPAGAPAQTIKISGTLSAAGKTKGTQGGTIVVSGEHIKLTNARVDASGRAGGGKVLIGGDWGGGKPNTSLVNNPSAKLESFAIPTATTVSVDAGTTINASAGRAATAARSCCGRTARPRLLERSSRRAALRAAMAALSKRRATDSSHSLEMSTRARHGAKPARCCSIPRTFTSLRAATVLASPRP
jgi:filamentous hemagglutinin family protein